MREDCRKITQFIAQSPSVYHVVANLEKKLADAGFIALREDEPFSVREGGRYYVSRNSSSLIAFRVPEGRIESVHAISAHTDSPSLKLKPTEPDVSSSLMSRLNVEAYGGLDLQTWYDRPLSVAGRVYVNTPEGIEMRLADFARDLVSIPSLAVHQQKKGEDGMRKTSLQKEALPVFSLSCDPDGFINELASLLSVRSDDIFDYDLFLYNRTPASFWGRENEFFSSPKLDDLVCAYTAIEALVCAPESTRLQLVALFDNEETGSASRQGALSDFLPSVWRRIFLSLGYSDEEMEIARSSGFMISADNAHAAHPGHMDRSDPVSHPVINGGVVIKYTASQKYTTDAASASWLRSLMRKHGIPCQVFVNHSDMTGGSTLGSLSQQKLSLRSADIGIAQLAMHSSYECAGADDCTWLRKLFEVYLED